MTLRLAEPIDDTETRLRLAYSAAELGELQEQVDMAEAALAHAQGVEHGARLARRLQLVTAAQAVLAAASEYMEPIADVRAGQLFRIEECLVRVRSVSPTVLDVERGANGTVTAAHPAGVELIPEHATIEVLVDGGGSPIVAGDKAQVVLPFAGRVDRVRLVADQVGSTVVDLVRSTFGDPPGSGVSITAAAKPELDAAANYEDDTLEGWTRDLEVDDVLGVVVEDATTIERLTLVLTIAM